MSTFHDHRFPGESEAYRAARDALTQAEMNLRQRIEAVAALRRALPLGGKLKEDYVFEEGAADLADTETVKRTRFSELFAEGKPSLILYSFMYSPEAQSPCPMCTSLLDGLNGNVPHVQDRVNLAVVAKAPISRIREWARARGWTRLRLLSSGGTTYNADYFAESPDGEQWSSVNVFTRTDDGIYHTYSTELFFAKADPGQNPRHADLIWPLWNLFDLTPEGRGTDWYPKYTYD